MKMAVYGGRPARVSSTATFDWMMRAEGLRVSAIRSQGGNAGRGYSLVSPTGEGRDGCWVGARPARRGRLPYIRGASPSAGGMEVRGRPIGGDECA